LARNRLKHKFTLSLFLIASAFALSRAQVLDFPQTVVVKPDTSAAKRDSLVATDTSKTKLDSLAVKPASGIDSVVTYSAADSIVYSLSTKTMYLFGKGNIKYKELGLKAEQIDINWNTSVLNAQGVADTSDTSGSGYRGLPDLIDGGETYRGSRILSRRRDKENFV
jgi:lipopolysaccharide assembly outer membrane protein LptD (OstA)